MYETLKACRSREEAREILKGKTVKQLKEMGIAYCGRTKKEIIESIVYITVGARIDAEVIRNL